MLPRSHPLLPRSFNPVLRDLPCADIDPLEQGIRDLPKDGACVPDEPPAEINAAGAPSRPGNHPSTTGQDLRDTEQQHLTNIHAAEGVNGKAELEVEEDEE